MSTSHFNQWSGSIEKIGDEFDILNLATDISTDSNGKARFPAILMDNFRPVDLCQILADWMTTLWVQSGQRAPLPFAMQLSDPTDKNKISSADITNLSSHLVNNYTLNGQVFTLIPSEQATVKDNAYMTYDNVSHSQRSNNKQVEGKNGVDAEVGQHSQDKGKAKAYDNSSDSSTDSEESEELESDGNEEHHHKIGANDEQEEDEEEDEEDELPSPCNRKLEDTVEQGPTTLYHSLPPVVEKGPHPMQCQSHLTPTPAPEPPIPLIDISFDVDQDAEQTTVKVKKNSRNTSMTVPPRTRGAAKAGKLEAEQCRPSCSAAGKVKEKTTEQYGLKQNWGGPSGTIGASACGNMAGSKRKRNKAQGSGQERVQKKSKRII
ncbi:hypothetical protein E1B28_000802 [Marasmius oreades]|uniref:Uncharacterized protein n=1 Tax=Marasmius oreades TaxID=181124 RepID=A0A9P7V2A0_9AGAR|nr:uncharacterized protein E1B28_000802 [Marasmius oreades]KAG7098902.1 hypothetical protein E1B28_000802 [Marasmius oreades]